jgi:hypothetical protein
MSNIDWSQIITREQREAEARAGAWAALRGARDARLAELDWLITRHYEETLAEGRTPTLTPQLFDALFVYRQALRDLPENTEDPAHPVWPVNPLLAA